MQTPFTLFVPLSGRAQYWPAMRDFLRTAPAGCHVKLCDTSQDPTFHKMIASKTPANWMIYTQTVGPAGLADFPRNPVRHLVQRSMCDIYQRMSDELATEYCLIVEDDISPRRSASELFEALFRGLHAGAAGVTALYKSRFFDDFVAWKAVNKISGIVDPLSEDWIFDGNEFGEIGGSGFGCLLIRKAALQSVRFEVPQYGWFDPYYFERLAAAGFQNIAAKRVFVSHAGRA